MNFEQWIWKTWKRLDGRQPEEVGRQYTQVDVRTMMSTALSTLVDELAEGGQLSLCDLGQIKVIEQQPRRVANNLRGGQIHQVEARRTARLAPSKELVRRLNNMEETHSSGP